MADTKNNEAVKVDSMSAFFTRDRANEGIIVPLCLPTGEETDKWLRVRGMDSDLFRDSQARAMRELAALEDEPSEEKRREAAKLIQRKAIAALVMGWNLPEEFTEANLLRFLEAAPQIADQVDRLATRRALFFRQRPWSSSDGQNGSSDSKSPRPDPSSP